jgi:hypothetical protein
VSFRRFLIFCGNKSGQNGPFHTTFFVKSTFPHAGQREKKSFFHSEITFFHTGVTFFHAGITFFHAGITFLHARITFFQAGDNLSIEEKFRDKQNFDMLYINVLVLRWRGVFLTFLEFSTSSNK